MVVAYQSRWFCGWSRVHATVYNTKILKEMTTLTWCTQIIISVLPASEEIHSITFLSSCICELCCTGYFPPMCQLSSWSSPWDSRISGRIHIALWFEAEAAFATIKEDICDNLMVEELMIVNCSISNYCTLGKQCNSWLMIKMSELGVVAYWSRFFNCDTFEHDAPIFSSSNTNNWDYSYHTFGWWLVHATILTISSLFKRW